MKPNNIPELTQHEIETFTDRVRIKGQDECWPWVSYLNRTGYGTFRIRGKHAYAHRIAYTIWIGSIPQGLTVDHVAARGCIDKSCCNPAHLEAVPQSENVLRWLREHKLGDTCSCGKPRRNNKDSRCRECYNAWMRVYQRQWRQRRAAL